MLKVGVQVLPTLATKQFDWSTTLWSTRLLKSYVLCARTSTLSTTNIFYIRGFSITKAKDYLFCDEQLNSLFKIYNEFRN